MRPMHACKLLNKRTAKHIIHKKTSLRYVTLGHSYQYERLPRQILWKSRDNAKTQVTSNALNETPRFDEVNLLEAVLVGFNY